MSKQDWTGAWLLALAIVLALSVIAFAVWRLSVT